MPDASATHPDRPPSRRAPEAPTTASGAGATAQSLVGPRPEPALSAEAAAVLQTMREQVRAQSGYRARILARHPAPADLDLPAHPDAARAAERVEARLAALEEPASARSAAPARAPTLSAEATELQPALLERIASAVHAHGVEAHRAEEALRERVRLIAPAAEIRAAAAVHALEVGSAEEAGLKARTALGARGFDRERDEVAGLAGRAWDARSRLDRVTDRAAELLEMRRAWPGAAPSESVRVGAGEVLREVERRRAELRRASLERRALSDRSLLPGGEPRMQEGGAYQDIRSIECLRCGTTAGREDGRSRLHTDGTPKRDREGVPERFAPRDGELCTPCWLSSAPMSVAELKLSQRQARLLESTQVHLRPGQVGWEERAGPWTEAERARRGGVTALEELLNAPSPWVVRPSPAETADRRMEELLERESQREEALEKRQWDLPGDREADWWETKFPGMFSGEPDARPESSPEQRLRLETERLAEAQRRLLTVVGVEDPSLRRVLETQAAVRLHLAQGSAVREAWEATRAIPRAEARAAAREQVRQRFLAPETLAYRNRLREARGMVLPKDMPLEMQSAIRARQVERILADLDVPTLVRRVEQAARSAEHPASARAAAHLLQRLGPALEDTRLQGAVAAAQLAPTARQERGVFHSGLDEAVLPGERRGEAHERGIDRWLRQRERDGSLPPGEVRSARELTREVGDLNPRHEVKEHTPSKADGTLPWQLQARDGAIAQEVAATGYSAPDRILAALEQYRDEVIQRGPEIGEPYDEGTRERLIEAAAQQSGFAQEEVDRLREIQALSAATEHPRAFDELMREAGAWAADPDRNNDPARLREALEVRTRNDGQLVFTDADLALLARAERAAAPYLDVFNEYRAAWTEHDRPAMREAEHAARVEGAPHPAVRDAVQAHADPRIAEIAGELAALREFERIDPAYQEARRQIDRAGTILEATAETRDAAQRGWTEAEQTVRAQFSNPETLLSRVREMDADQVRALAASLRQNPLALTANHPRTGGTPRIPGINAAGVAERLEPHLKTVRAQGLRGLMGQVDASATERQARVVAVALETWAEARHRGDQTRAWAAGQLGLPSDTPLAKVREAARERLTELASSHQELIRSWQQLTPAPTLAQIERRLRGFDPATAALARETFPELDSAPRAPAGPHRPERVLAPPALSR